MNEKRVPSLGQKPSSRPGRPSRPRPTGWPQRLQNRLCSATCGSARSAVAGSTRGTAGTSTSPAPSRLRIDELDVRLVLRRAGRLPPVPTEPLGPEAAGREPNPAEGPENGPPWPNPAVAGPLTGPPLGPGIGALTGPVARPAGLGANPQASQNPVSSIVPSGQSGCGHGRPGAAGADRADTARADSEGAGRGGGTWTAANGTVGGAGAFAASPQV